MTILIQLVSSDPEMLAELHSSIGQPEVTASEPREVEDAAALNFDLAGADFIQLWDMLVAVGQLGGAVQVAQSIVNLLHRRRDSGVITTVEAVVDGAKVTFSGDMTPTEAVNRLNEFNALAGASEAR